MEPAQIKEVDRILLNISHARMSAENGVKELTRIGSEPYVVEAVQTAVEELEQLHSRLMKGTYFGVPDPQPKLFKAKDGSKTTSS